MKERSLPDGELLVFVGVKLTASDILLARVVGDVKDEDDRSRFMDVDVAGEDGVLGVPVSDLVIVRLAGVVGTDDPVALEGPVFLSMAYASYCIR